MAKKSKSHGTTTALVHITSGTEVARMALLHEIHEMQPRALVQQHLDRVKLAVDNADQAVKDYNTLFFRDDQNSELRLSEVENAINQLVEAASYLEHARRILREEQPRAEHRENRQKRERAAQLAARAREPINA